MLKFHARATSALLVALAVAGCVTDQDLPLDDVEQSASAATPDYFRLDRALPAGGYVVTRVNGGAMRCPDGQVTNRCTVDDLVLPADCDWECRDGVLSMRGVTVLRGQLRSSRTSSPRVRTSLVAFAAFDTFDASIGGMQVYRLQQKVQTCPVAPCPIATTAIRLNSVNELLRPTTVDFSRAHDPNYVLEPERGAVQMARPEGLIASGMRVGGVFRVDRVWRQWAPLADCDVDAAARAHAWPTPPSSGEVQRMFSTTLEAEQYRDSRGRSVRWLVRTENTTTAIKYTSGINDLWAETFEVSTTTCAVTTTGEH